MAGIVDLAGKKFEMLTVISRAENTKAGKAARLCECDCGKSPIVVGGNIMSGNSTNCGCVRLKNAEKRLTTHGEFGTRLYAAWANMKRRTTNPNNHNYAYYGGRGISVCADWESYEAFRDWAVVNGYQADLELDRIDNDGNYEPSNCRWVPRKKQANNMRKNRVITYNGETHSLSEWAEITGIKRATLSNRINTYGWSVERALTER
jgi:hypothetical protein